MRRIVQLVAAMALALPALVCAQQQAPAPPAPRPDDVAARVGDRVITVAEVDEAWRKTDSGGHAQAAQAMYDGRKQALDEMVANLLIEQAARAKGQSADQFTRDEVGRRSKTVSDADVEAFYNQNTSRMQGKPLDEVRGAIRNFLQQQGEAAARSALIAELRRAGPAVSVALDPPRQHIEVAPTDPSRGAADARVVLVEYSDYQ